MSEFSGKFPELGNSLEERVERYWRVYLQWFVPIPTQTVYCVLCTVYCVLCTVYCVLCTVYCVLCTVYCVLCTVYCVLCTVYSESPKGVLLNESGRFFFYFTQTQPGNLEKRGFWVFYWAKPSQKPKNPVFARFRPISPDFTRFRPDFTGVGDTPCYSFFLFFLQREFRKSDNTLSRPPLPPSLLLSLPPPQHPLLPPPPLPTLCPSEESDNAEGAGPSQALTGFLAKPVADCDKGAHPACVPKRHAPVGADLWV